MTRNISTSSGSIPHHMSEGRILHINVSRGGVPKHPVEHAVVTTEGIVGDYQRDQRNHGGPTRALCLFTIEEIQHLQAEGHPIVPGSAGENITLQGLDLASLTPGTRLALGAEVEIELTSYTMPCENITASFSGGDFTRISHKLYPGESRVYARVLRGGTLTHGQSVTITHP